MAEDMFDNLDIIFMVTVHGPLIHSQISGMHEIIYDHIKESNF